MFGWFKKKPQTPPLAWESLRLEQLGSKDFGPCSCCGHMSRRIWGNVYDSGGALAVYYVHWTLKGIGTHGANFDIILGEFGEGTSSNKRTLACVEFRIINNSPACMAIDATPRQPDYASLAAHVYNRKDIIGTSRAQPLFAIVDAVLIKDNRLGELRNEE